MLSIVVRYRFRRRILRTVCHRSSSRRQETHSLGTEVVNPVADAGAAQRRDKVRDAPQPAVHPPSAASRQTQARILGAAATRSAHTTTKSILPYTTISLHISSSLAPGLGGRSFAVQATPCCKAVTAAVESTARDAASDRMRYEISAQWENVWLVEEA